MSAIFVTGTGTGVGKSHAAAALLLKYSLYYWKPVQTGFPTDDDTETVRRLSGVEEKYFLEPEWRLREPLSPHRAAELEGVTVRVGALAERYHAIKERPLLIEGAGGLYVPLNRAGETWVPFLHAIGVPVILVASTGLGTINHTLLSVEALRREGLVCAGIFFCGPDNPDNIQTILSMSRLPCLGSFDIASGEIERKRIDPDRVLPRYLRGITKLPE